MADPALLDLLQDGHERLLSEVLASQDEPALADLAQPWFDDDRPHVRAALLAYVDDGCARAYHRPLVKRVFKLAEAKGDDEALAHFFAAFDRWQVRKLRTRTRWDYAARQLFQETKLVFDKKIPRRAPSSHSVRNPMTGQLVAIGAEPIDMFSRRTRAYLSRRAFRYFRHLGFRDHARYRRALAIALSLYRDEHLQEPEQLLDAWCLIHALFGRSKVLSRMPGGVRLAPGHTLKELEPAPMFEDAWFEGFDELLTLLEHAGCRPVRSFALAMLRRHHDEALKSLSAPRLRALLRSTADEVHALVAELLKTAPGLDTLPISEWLELLRVDSATVLPLVCELVKQHVSPDRLDLAQCVDLACAPAAPVAELGLSWAKVKPIRSADDLDILVRLAKAQAKKVRVDAMDWLFGVLKESKDARPEQVRDLIDAAFVEPRARGLALMLEDDRFKDLPMLWSALAESPFDDVRGALVKHLEDRAKHFAPETIRHVWASCLLAVHRGGRTKRLVTRQLAERIAHKPGDADALLPLLKIALRSIRAPERRAALAALAQVAFRTPSLRASIEKLLPELKLFAAEAAA
jgi:hypothetical protein